jgi:uncharacterized repeat protein (TIGR03943 family)
LVAPHIAFLLELTLGVLVVMTLYALLTFFTNRSACECDHDHHHEHNHEHRSNPVSLLLVVPVVLGLLVPTQALGASMMNNGLQALPKVDLSKVPRSEDAKYVPKPPKPEEGSELSLYDVAENILIAPEYYFNRSFKFTGFVYHPDGWPSNRMILTRYLITCCVADATPIGITVETKDAAKYKNNSWVEIDGTILTEKIPQLDNIDATSWYNGYPDKPVVFAHSIKQIKEPKDPYIYPTGSGMTGGN